MPSRHLILLALLSLSVAAGCEPSTPVTTDSEGVSCVGLPASKRALLDAPHPFIYRGEVRAVQGETRRSSLLDWLVPSAHGYALEEEQPVAGARVTLSYIDPVTRAPTAHSPAYDAITDDRGRFCLVAPHEPDARTSLLLTARAKDLELEQLATYSFDADLNAVSTAATALALDHAARTRAPLTDAQWLNLRTLADTRVGLLSPVDTSAFSSHTRLVEHITQRLRQDPDISAILTSR